MKALGASDPREIGRYRILAELGRGGMGRVLLGTGPDGRLVAVKLVRAQLVEDEDFRSRFRREVSASRRVSGAYTAAVVDADADAPTPWLASVFVPGPSLADVIAQAGPLPADAAVRLAAGLAAALVDVHGAGLVHRDLKPSNVLLSADGPRVIDFGIARAADSEGGSEITHTGWLIGSPGFMSPEQAEGGALTSASDVFSLGCVLFLACTGKGPFVGPSTPQTLYNVVHSQPDLSAVPDEVRGVVERCLAKDPAERPTPAGLLEDLAPLITPATKPWPRPVHDLITHQEAEVAALLSAPRDDETVAVPHDPVTMAVTRHLPPEPVAVARPRATNPAGPIWAAVAGFVVIACLVVWALWPERDTDSSADSSSTTTTEDTPTYAYSDETTDTTTEEETTTTDEPSPEYTEETTTEEEEYDSVYDADEGDCAWAEDPDTPWEVVPCEDYVFEVLTVLHGTSTHDDCGDDVRVRLSTYREEDDPDLSTRVCMTFRYGNDGAYARMNHCLVLVGSGDDTDPTFTDCDNATHYVSGYDSDTFDPSLCGSDGWHGWEDNGAWGEYLNYTICIRRR
ncbi:protein kinase [Actinophytocola sp. NPDC049390]|uniref:serine/threonine-protein kinase n=1 Tax=Actinophytocola sp. NPDC049390 TaxID=3363894 RepID=UPI003798E4EE